MTARFEIVDLDSGVGFVSRYLDLDNFQLGVIRVGWESTQSDLYLDQEDFHFQVKFELTPYQECSSRVEILVP